MGANALKSFMYPTSLTKEEILNMINTDILSIQEDDFAKKLRNCLLAIVDYYDNLEPNMNKNRFVTILLIEKNLLDNDLQLITFNDLREVFNTIILNYDLKVSNKTKSHINGMLCNGKIKSFIISLKGLIL